jgi:hypothetical protein
MLLFPTLRLSRLTSAEMAAGIEVSWLLPGAGQAVSVDLAPTAEAGGRT